MGHMCHSQVHNLIPPAAFPLGAQSVSCACGSVSVLRVSSCVASADSAREWGRLALVLAFTTCAHPPGAPVVLQAAPPPSSQLSSACRTACRGVAFRLSAVAAYALHALAAVRSAALSAGAWPPFSDLGFPPGMCLRRDC